MSTSHNATPTQRLHLISTSPSWRSDRIPIQSSSSTLFGSCGAQNVNSRFSWLLEYFQFPSIKSSVPSTTAFSRCSSEMNAKSVYLLLKRVCVFVLRAKSSSFIEHSNELLGYDELLLKHCKRRVFAKFNLQDHRVTSYVTQRCQFLHWRTR